MIHSTIESNDVIERYSNDELKGEELNSFEAHYMDCDRCLEQLELQQAYLLMKKGGKQIAEELNKTNSFRRLALYLVRLVYVRNTYLKGFVIAGFLVALILPLVMLKHENSILQEKLKKAPIAMLDSLNHMQFLTLEPLRNIGSSDGPMHILELISSKSWLLLILEISPPYFDLYDVTIFDINKKTLWSKQHLQMDQADNLNLILPTNAFAKDEPLNSGYFVSVNQSNIESKENFRANFSFQVKK